MSATLQASPPNPRMYRTVFAEALVSRPGYEKASQYRAKITQDDMTRKAIRTGEDDFVKYFLEIPSDVDSAHYPKPELAENPFTELENAQSLGMLEAEISATMVSEQLRGYRFYNAVLTLN